jgi:CspA family cold shock protein
VTASDRRERGVVRSWDTSKGHGWIQADGGEVVWCHFSQIQAEGFRMLAAGQRVEFETVEAPGPPSQRIQAREVAVVQDER